MPESPTPIIAGTRIGHVHLKVADLDRALGFYCGVLGFEVTQRLSSGAACSFRPAATTTISA
jgi:catechol 2,3-dioxygenase